MEFILIILSSILFTISNYFPDLFFMSWFAFIPLIYLIKDYDYSHSFIIALMVGFLNAALSLYWLYQPLRSALEMPFSFNLFILFIYFLYSALPMGIWVIINKFMQPQESYSPFVAALSWSVLEYLRFEFLNLNPFNYFAYSQSHFNFIARYAAYGGIFLVSFISVLIASYLVKVYLEANWKKAVPLVAIFIILTLVPLFTGTTRDSDFQQQNIDLLINNSRSNANRFETIEKEIDDFINLIENKNSKFVFTASDNFSFDFIRNGFYREKLFIELENKLSNSYLQLGSRAAESENYNSQILDSLFLLSEDLEVIHRSDKQMNFLTGINLINKEELIYYLAGYFNFNDEMIKKPKSIDVIELEELHLINLIADEIFIPIVSIKNNHMVDTNLIINAAAEEKIDSKVYNNLSLSAAVYRAAESNRTLLRAVSGGYSAVINQQGKIMEKEKLKNTLQTYNINLHQEQSFYQKHPKRIINIILTLFSIILFIKILLVLRKKLSSRD